MNNGIYIYVYNGIVLRAQMYHKLIFFGEDFLLIDSRYDYDPRGKSAAT